MRTETLIAPHGRIVAEYFDIDRSRSIPPQRRPEASRPLDSLPDPDRGFQAVVIGEPQRVFYGSQSTMTSPVFEHYGVQLWVPEIGGPIDPANEAHELIMSMYGGISKGERTRIRTRVRAAMTAQALLKGRYSGGVRRTDTCSWTRARIPTRPELLTARGCTGWPPIPRRLGWCEGSSLST
ncbi:hypothetical protein HNR06_002803 [Nocardiopsis arvandica]|uniref:Uncharacterized protein n=1 Tax=Nocardiopsis sinuspersici TaxID=501010 RepID=A0A7Y9XCE3_9ACTN|nr:recombinase family protein [Nocardiopsis sinuspersici]NYH53214.1 hypothetical protein [Nocardiopsis sinuspersici]